MRLLLKNFKQHKNLDIELPDTGMIQISGESGVGKTTIFEAISEIINGDRTDVVTWGEETGEYILELNNPQMRIRRTRKPNSLQVEVPPMRGIWIDDQAQELIYKRLNANSDEFSVAAYIQQKQSNSLVSLKPADMTRMVNKLSNKGLDPDLFKKFVNQQITEKENKIKELEIKKEDLIEQCSKLTKKVESSGSIAAPNHTKKPDSFESVENLNNTLLDYKTKISRVRNNEDLKKSIERDMLLLKEILDQKHDIVDFDPTDLINAEQEMKSVETWEKLYKIQEEAGSYGFKGGSTTMWVESEIKIVQDLIASLDTKRLDIMAELSEIEWMKDPQACPHCAGPVMVNKGKVLVYLKPTKTIDEVNIKLSENRKENEQLEKRRKTLENMYSRILSLLEETKTLPKIILGKKEEYKNNLVRLTKLRQDCTTAAAMQMDFNRRAKSLLGSIERDEKQYQEEKAKLPQVTIEFLEQSIEDVARRREDLVLQEERYQSYLRALKAYNVHLGLLESIDRDIIILQQEVTSTTLNLTQEKNKMKEYLKVVENIELSAMAAIESVLGFINLAAKKYIDQLFPDTGTVINILNISTTKKGEERAKPSIEMYHKGNKCKGISSLSGGEQSRVSLAFQLGLSELHSIPFLMIDEGFQGLSIEAKREGLEFLKTCATNRLIMVIEHGAPEHLFDKVIDL